MVEIILLIFLTRHIGLMAKSRGLNKTSWKIKMVLFWILFEMLGVYLGVTFFGFTVSITKIEVRFMLFSITCAFGGYLWVRNQLEKIPKKTDSF